MMESLSQPQLKYRWDLIDSLTLQAEVFERGEVKLWLKIPESLREKSAEHIQADLKKFLEPAFNGSFNNVTMGDGVEALTHRPDVKLAAVEAPCIQLTLKKGAANLYREQAERIAEEKESRSMGVYLS